MLRRRISATPVRSRSYGRGVPSRGTAPRSSKSSKVSSPTVREMLDVETGSPSPPSRTEIDTMVVRRDRHDARYSVRRMRSTKGESNPKSRVGSPRHVVGANMQARCPLLDPVPTRLLVLQIDRPVRLLDRSVKESMLLGEIVGALQQRRSIDRSNHAQFRA